MAGVEQAQSAMTPVRTAWLAHAIPFVVLALAALAMIHPALGAPATTIIGLPGDNIQYVYAAGWIAEALRTGTSPFVDWRINPPVGLALLATDVPYLGYAAVAPLTWLSGAVFGYNAQLVLAHMLSGLGAYLWIRRLTGSVTGGLVAGLAFMLAPFRLAHSYGHPQIVSTYPLPLFFWALDESLRTHPARRVLLALAGATFLLSSASQYYLVIGLVSGTAYAVLTLATRRLNPLHGAWLAAPMTLAGALPGSAPYLMVSRSGVYVPYELDAVRMWSASPMNFVMPSHLHPLWGALVDQMRPETLWVEKTLYVGLVATILAVVALRAFDRRLAWIGTALVAAILALGTDLHTGNLPVNPETPFWLPAYYLNQLPVLELMRVWARFGIVTILFVALLAGVGAARLMRGRGGEGESRRLGDGRAGKWGSAIVAVALVALVVIDLLPGRMQSFTLEPRPIDRWLAQQPGALTVGFVPVIDDVTNYRILFGTLFHGKQTFAFMHQAHMPPIFQEFNERSRGFPDSASAMRLRDLGVRYLLLEKPIFDGKRAFRWSVVERRLAQTPELYVVTQVGDVVVVGFR
ncbi:MAG: hypothetical protein HXY39_03940 [Chloroflexi bacterium]|nr:hypothetical protein [Chloroflexota bacterium]